MRSIGLRIVTCFVLLSCASAFADSIVGSGGSLQSWTLSGLPVANSSSPTPYWNGSSSDTPKCNIGMYLAGATGCVIPGGGPGEVDYWGMVGGAADPSFYFNKASSSSNAALKIEIAGNAGINSFGWYELGSPSTSHVIFSGGNVAGNTFDFTPTAQYGFWFTGATGNGTYYTQSEYSVTDKNIQHFAVFQQLPSTYWLGMEDLNYSGSDKDFQDMVVKVSPVPDGGVTLMLLGGALVGLGALRRKFRA
jgi:hypothetical protein